MKAHIKLLVNQMKNLFVLLLFTTHVWAQNPPPPPINPLPAPLDPVGNESTFDKVMLGKVLYWDEQMSSTKTVACASCHIMSSGGTDPRSNVNNPLAKNPGLDNLFNTADDITGSPGVAETNSTGDYQHNLVFGYESQVTGRKAPSAINAGYANSLFWDGRAGDQLIDPITNETVLPSGAALEAQVLGPPVSSTEMAHTGRTWKDVITSIERSSPLALSPIVPNDIVNWVGSQSYYQLFESAFGNTEITASKIAMAIASYERSLFSNQTPFDQSINGNANALTQQERAGQAVFAASQCIGCHTGALMSDNNFHNIGVSPNNEDEGRFAVTGQIPDMGRFKTPPLRNLENRASFMHSGTFSTLEQVVDFYDRGGDFSNPNLDPRIRPLNLNQNQKNSLLAFLRRPLTDVRVTNETGPFESPLLFSESDRLAIISGEGVAGTGSKIPFIYSNQPPLLGNKSFTLALENALPGAESIFVVSTLDPGTDELPDVESAIIYTTKTLLSGNNDGHVSLSIELPSSDSYNGKTLFGRWYVVDNQAINGYAISPLLEFTLFKPDFGHAGQIFSAGFD